MDPLFWEEELKQRKKDGRKVVNTKAKKTAQAFLSEEKKKEISEIKQLNYEGKTFLKRKCVDNWIFIDSDWNSNSRSSNDEDKILKG